MPLGDGEVPPAERAAAFAAAGAELGERDGERWRIGPWKLFLDGGGSLGTALLHEPWPGTDGYYGNQTTSTEGLRAYAVWAARDRSRPRRPLRRRRRDRPLPRSLRRGGARCGRWPGLGFTVDPRLPLALGASRCARIRDLGVLVATQSPLQWSFGPGLVRRFGAEAVGRAHPMRCWLRVRRGRRRRLRRHRLRRRGAGRAALGLLADATPDDRGQRGAGRPAGGDRRRAGAGPLHDRRRRGGDGARPRPPGAGLRRRPRRARRRPAARLAARPAARAACWRRWSPASSSTTPAERALGQIGAPGRSSASSSSASGSRPRPAGTGGEHQRQRQSAPTAAALHSAGLGRGGGDDQAADERAEPKVMSSEARKTPSPAPRSAGADLRVTIRARAG